MLTELPVERLRPRHELETDAVIDHGEPPRSERHALPHDAGDILAFGGRPMQQAGRLGEPGRHSVDLSIAKRREEIAREDNATAASFGKPCRDEMVGTRRHRGLNARPEPGVGQCHRAVGDQLAIEPGRPFRSHLRIEIEV